MSRHYELLQRMQSSRTFFLDPNVERVFPSTGKSGGLEDARRQASEVTRGLVQRIFREPARSPQVVVFAAIDHGSGASQMAASVAEVLASSSPGKVCLVEGNFRSPALADLLETTNYQGLSDALVQTGSVRPFMKPLRDQSLWVLTSGPLAGDAAKLLATERMASLAAELRKEFAYVIVDAPPLSRYPDALTLGRFSDGVLVVVEADATRRGVARRAVDHLRGEGIPVLGAVLNKHTYPNPAALHQR